jgi:hypothetical protein
MRVPLRSNVRHFEVDEAVELKWRLCHFQWHELPTELKIYRLLQELISGHHADTERGKGDIISLLLFSLGRKVALKASCNSISLRCTSYIIP